MCSGEPKHCVCCFKPKKNRIISTQVSSDIRKWFLMKKQPLEVVGFIIKYFDTLTFPKLLHVSYCMVQRCLHFYTETSKQFTAVSVTPQVRIWSGIHSPQQLSIVQNCTFVLLSSLCTGSSIFVKNSASCTFLTIPCLNGVSRAACFYLWLALSHISGSYSTASDVKILQFLEVKIPILNCAL